MSTSATETPPRMPAPWTPPARLGAHLDNGQCTFHVWAPAMERVEVRLENENRNIAMQRHERGYFSATVDGLTDGARYMYVLDGEKSLPDPASRHQPDGVHKASAVVATDHAWTDSAWKTPGLDDLVVYELHIGTFTPEGTFDAAITQLERLRDIGINAIEIMPIAEFPGGRNWGYDGVFPLAAQSTYGGPAGLKRLVNAAHQIGIAVILDVVYNHVGPEGNYLPAYGPYFTDRYRTPWGDALNYDGPDSDEVRAFFIQSALQWVDEFHIDGLRFDAVHAIVDASARPFLAELTDSIRERAAQTGRNVILIAESDLSDPRIIHGTDRDGFGFDTQWLDDFHHAIHAVTTGEDQGYYADYGSLDQLALCLQRAYVFAGDYSQFRRRRHGAPATGATPQQFVVCAQNHDQIGNRLAGDRLSTLVSFEQLRLIAACTVLGPYVPMLFMGEEYGEQKPFPYFVSHGDPQLVEAVRKGRKEEFASFGWSQEPPDPQGEGTFRSAIIDPSRAKSGEHRALLDLHRDLIAVRRDIALLQHYDALTASVVEDGRVLDVLRTGKGGSGGRGRAVRLIANFSERAHSVALDGAWSIVIATDDPRYSPDLAATFERIETREARRDARARASGSLTVSPFTAVLLEREPA